MHKDFARMFWLFHKLQHNNRLWELHSETINYKKKKKKWQKKKEYNFSLINILIIKFLFLNF